jgi:hypothetical protein
MNACSAASKSNNGFRNFGIHKFNRFQHTFTQDSDVCRHREALPLLWFRLMHRKEQPLGPTRLIPSNTSASTVGLPRESKISRATTSTIALMFIFLSFN